MASDAWYSLSIPDAPACRRSEKDVYGVARDETVNISCEVDSDPTDLTFRWSLNNSVDSIELHDFKSSGVLSVITYTPKTVSDYGVLQCWARNPVGEQKDPCTVRIIHAGKKQIDLVYFLRILDNKMKNKLNDPPFSDMYKSLALL